MNHHKHRVALALVAAALAGCGKTDAPSALGSAVGPASSASGAGGAPVSVSTVRAAQRDFELQIETTGTVTALNSVDVKPQVSATIAQVHFREGQFVQAGQLLFTLDARAQQAAAAQAQAQLRKDMAALADAQRQLARSRELVAQGFVSQVAVDTNQTLVDTQRALIEADRAAIQAAQVQVSYARIVAPSAGRAGTVGVFPGTLVQPASPPLVTITQLHPIAVTFNLPQRDLPDALQSLRAGGGKVTAVLPDRRGEVPGKLAFVDNNVDASSGTVKVKAVFDNPDERLWPGAFVNVRLAVRTLKDAIVVPQAAIVQGARGRVVFVVQDDGKVASRPVELVHAAGNEAVVSGVRAGERIVLDGRQNVRPGSAVVERAPDAAAGARGGRAAPAANGASAVVEEAR